MHWNILAPSQKENHLLISRKSEKSPNNEQLQPSATDPPLDIPRLNLNKKPDKKKLSPISVSNHVKQSNYKQNVFYGTRWLMKYQFDVNCCLFLILKYSTWFTRLERKRTILLYDFFYGAWIKKQFLLKL